MKCPHCQSTEFNVCEKYTTIDRLMLDDGELVAEEMIDNEREYYFTGCCGVILDYQTVITLLKQKQGIE